MLLTVSTVEHTSHRFYVWCLNVAEIGRLLRADLPLVDTGRHAVAEGAGSEKADMMLSEFHAIVLLIVKDVWLLQ